MQSGSEFKYTQSKLTCLKIKNFQKQPQPQKKYENFNLKLKFLFLF